jgi:hypothetical protein
MRRILTSYPLIAGTIVLVLVGGLVIGSLRVASRPPAPVASAAKPAGTAPQKLSLAPAVQVLASAPQSTILQFPLVPAAIKAAYPGATGVVTVVEGYQGVSLTDTVTVDVYKMPAGTTFTVFLTELANAPFGHFEYVADLYTGQDGTGETTFRAKVIGAYAGDARDPGLSTGLDGLDSGYELQHVGLWFASLKDAQAALHSSTLKGTPFAPGSPPLHAGPLAMTDGQTAPVF